jgi:hypothetical protein
LEYRLEAVRTMAAKRRYSSMPGIHLFGVPGSSLAWMAGYTAEVSWKRAVHDETARFLEKPFTPNTLVSKVREVLEH